MQNLLSYVTLVHAHTSNGKSSAKNVQNLIMVLHSQHRSIEEEGERQDKIFC